MRRRGGQDCDRSSEVALDVVPTEGWLMLLSVAYGMNDKGKADRNIR